MNIRENMNCRRLTFSCHPILAALTALTAFVAFFLLGAATAQAQITTLGSFNSTNGANPYGSLTLSGSALYGATDSGGANSDGTVFSLQIVPEPSSLGMLMASLGVALGWQRFRRRGTVSTGAIRFGHGVKGRAVAARDALQRR